MATITGRVVNFFFGPIKDFSVGRPVFVRREGTMIATGTLDAADEFCVEVDNTAGELEITVGLLDAASVLLDFDGTDTHVEIMHNGVFRNS